MSSHDPIHERAFPDYIDRTIETVRVHREDDSCWTQWANTFADEILYLRADADRLRAALTEAETALNALKYGKASCGICGGDNGFEDRGWTDEQVPMQTCRDCGSPAVVSGSKPA